MSTVLPERWKFQGAMEEFFEQVMAELGHEGWALRWMEHDAYCWRDRKIIDVCPMDQDEVECKQMLLHEIAHIDTAVPHGNQHHPRFFARLEELCRRFMDTGLSEYQQKFKSWYV